MNDKYAIELADGKRYEGLTLNGNNYVADYELTAEMFPASGLKSVKVTCKGQEEESGKPYEYTEEYGMSHVVAVGRDESLGGWRVILKEYTREELRELAIDGNIEYIAMMSGVEL